MLTAFQRNWGIDQWVAHLKDQEIPVLRRSRRHLARLCEEEQDRIAPRDLATVVLEDPFLALKLLRRVEGHRSSILGQETTTALASVLQAGVDELTHIVMSGAQVDEAREGLKACIARAEIAAGIARAWATMRADVAADEVALAALLADSGELLLWHFAPELPEQALDELNSGRAQRTLQAQQQTAGFSFRQTTLALVDAWALPRLIAMLIRGSDTVRANIARLAGEMARHIVAHPENPALPSDLVNVGKLIPAASHEALIASLPISGEYKAQVLLAVARDGHLRDAG